MGKDNRGKELGKCLYQRKDGRYEARATVNGIKIGIIDKDLNVVKFKYAEARKQAERLVDFRKCNITLDEWFAEWFERYKIPRVKQSSIVSMKRSYKNIFGNYIGDIKLNALTTDHIQDVINLHQKAGKAASTVRNGLSLLQQCLERARNSCYIPGNPCYDLSVSWERDGAPEEQRYLSSEEQKVFLEAVEDSWYKEMFYIMFYTGLRVGEVGGLKWENIDFNKKEIRIRLSLSCNYENGVKKQFLGMPKTSNSIRNIPFMGEVEQMLKSQKRKQDEIKRELKANGRWRSEGELEDLVFTTTMGSPATRYIVEKEVNKVVKDINCHEQIRAVMENREPIEFEKATPHAIRHSFCSRCYEMGIDVKVTQKLMGHAHLSTTSDIYTHMAKKVVTNEVEKFGSIMNG